MWQLMPDDQTHLSNKYAEVCRFVGEQGHLVVAFLDLHNVDGGVVLKSEDEEAACSVDAAELGVFFYSSNNLLGFRRKSG